MTESLANGFLATVAMCRMFPATTGFSFDAWASVSAEFGVMRDPGGRNTSFTPGPVPMTRPGVKSPNGLHVCDVAPKAFVVMHGAVQKHGLLQSLVLSCDVPMLMRGLSTNSHSRL